MALELAGGEPQRACRFVLVGGYGGNGAAHQVPHLRRPPQGENDNRGELAGHIEVEGASGIEVDDEEEHHLRDDAQHLHVGAGEETDQARAHVHDQAQECATYKGERHRDEGDAHRDPQSLEEEGEVLRVEERAPAFPAARRNGGRGCGGEASGQGGEGAVRRRKIRGYGSEGDVSERQHSGASSLPASAPRGRWGAE